MRLKREKWERCDYWKEINEREKWEITKNQSKNQSIKTSKGKFLKIRERGEVRWEMRWLTGHKIRWWDEIFIPNKVSTIL